MTNQIPKRPEPPKKPAQYRGSDKCKRCLGYGFGVWAAPMPPLNTARFIGAAAMTFTERIRSVNMAYIREPFALCPFCGGKGKA